MKLSLNWLSDFIDWKENDPEAIARTLTASTAEVEEIERKGAQLQGVVVGKILMLAKHPNADRLSLCDVQTEAGKKHVVCGGANLRLGMCVAFAHVGTTVKWHGTETVTLEKTKIRGEESEGMICAAEELGLQEMFPQFTDHDIIDLGDGSEQVGDPLASALGIDDVVLHIDNHAITHRADLFSHIGFARECVALGLAKWKKELKKKTPAFPKTPLPFKCIVQDKKLTPRYCACLLEVGSIGETPQWMKARLEATGWRSVSLPVDITNYVLLERGMPLHSFDADDFHGDIVMRGAKRGESIVTLDNVKRELPEGAIVISDDNGIFDLLGIMGGLRSSTKATTKRIYLHSAALDPVSIRKTVIATGHRTDAATVYEKGVPLVTVKDGFDRALELFLQLVPGARIVSKMESWGAEGTAKSIPFSGKSIEKTLGVKIPETVMKKILADLGFKATRTAVTPPLWRLNDVRGPHDLTEEVGRIYGYDRIPSVMPAAILEPPARDARTDCMRDALKEQGYTEALALSILGPELLKACNLDPAAAVEISNALGEELSLLQPSGLPRLLEQAGRNILLTSDALLLFSIGAVFDRARETNELALLCASREETTLKTDPFLRIKEHLALVFGSISGSFEVHPSAGNHATAHPGRSAELLLNGKSVGTLFEVHPAVRARFGLPHRAAAALVDLSLALVKPEEAKIFSSLSDFPAVTYDVTLPMTQGKSVAELLRKLAKSSPLLEDVSVADLYDSSPMAKGQYSLTLRLTYRAKDRTLAEEEVKKEHERVMAVV